MSNDEITWVTCPTCGARVPWTAQSRYRPFCSKRCQLIDLGEWAEEKKYIPSNNQVADSDDWSEKE
ncbi:DNA gyrase inhibitor YacG [Martelella alba]|nr:DNA gyrase inhibitor YacG [Martelella alba]